MVHLFVKGSPIVLGSDDTRRVFGRKENLKEAGVLTLLRVLHGKLFGAGSEGVVVVLLERYARIVEQASLREDVGFVMHDTTIHAQARVASIAGKSSATAGRHGCRSESLRLSSI